jgi:PIN domain nuclease of toxin-antitoxin system
LRVLLDTHVVLWWAAGDRRLTRTATRAIAQADEVLVSPISCWEIATLVRLGRIELDRSPERWIDDLFAETDVHLAPFTADAAISAGALPDDFPGDPADRMIYATARDLLVPLVTKDRRLAACAHERRDVDVIW